MLDASLYAALGIGSIIGIVVSAGYHIHSSSQANHLAKDVTGLTVPIFINYTMLATLSGLFVILASMSFIVQDFKYPSAHTTEFILETVIFSLIIASLYIVSAYIRTGKISDKIYNVVALLFVKFAIGHLLFQASGYYTYLFHT